MLGSLFLISSYLLGHVLTTYFFPVFNKLTRIAFAVVIGLLISTWIVFLLALSLNQISHNPLIYATAITILIHLLLSLRLRKYIRNDYSLNRWHVGFFSLAFIFSWIVFSHTFSYDLENHNIILARLIWSDYGFHLPLIRSFSFGNNFVLDHPIFANEPLRYHFLFNFLVAILERGGLPLDLSLNIPSSLSFCCLMVLIFSLSRRLFYNSNFVGFTAVALFLLNSSLTFVDFFKQHGKQSANDILKTFWNMYDYISFGPWGDDIITAFWNINIYLNQRHLAFGFCVALIAAIFLVHEKTDSLYKHERKSYLFLGTISGLLVLWHGQVFICLLVLMGLFFIFFRDRKNLFFAIMLVCAVALPQILYLQYSSQDINSSFNLNPGYLVLNNLIPVDYFQIDLLNSISGAAYSFYRYWFFNIGLSLITLIISFFIVDRQRKFIFIIFLSLFIMGNTFQFSMEMAGNHKIFNLWLILANSFTAYLIYRIYCTGKVGIAISTALLIPLTLSGFIDLMPLKNNGEVVIEDIPKQPMATWVYNNTNSDDVFLTTYRMINPISLAGRRTAQGWPYFAWAGGYNTAKRDQIARTLYNPESLEEFCKQIKVIRIDYIQTELQFEKNPIFIINYKFYDDNFTPIFHDKTSKYEEKIYSTKNMCNKK